MALIRRDLYQDLINVRAALYDELEESTKRVERTESEIKEMEDSIANFDKTQADLKASIAELELTIEQTKEKIAALGPKIAIAKQQNDDARDQSQQKETEIKANQDKLAEAKAEGRPAEEIKALEEKINKLEAELLVINQRVDFFEKEIKSYEQQMVAYKQLEADSKASIEQSQKQVAENADQNAEYIELLPKLKTELVEWNSRKDENQAKYNDFITKNQDTINTFESQQLVRDKNIPKENPNKAFNRVPANAEETKQSNDILSNVVTEELKPATPEEVDQRNTWLEAGRKEDINPDFLTAGEASKLAFANMWSTKTVAADIKKAAENCELKVKFASLSNNLIYALQSVGYVIYLTDIANESSHIIVSWENIGAE